MVSERPTYGYRRIGILLRRKLKRKINHKKVDRLMKQASLLLTKAPRKPTRSHVGVVVTGIHNQRWCSDAFTIQCENGDAVNVVFAMDICDRQAMRYLASTGGASAQNVQKLLIETTEYRFGSPKAPHTV